MIDGGALTCVKLCVKLCEGKGSKSGRLVFGVKLFNDGEKGLKLFMMMRVNSRIRTVLDLFNKQLFKKNSFPAIFKFQNKEI
jgi:hypothetical protein